MFTTPLPDVVDGTGGKDKVPVAVVEEVVDVLVGVTVTTFVEREEEGASRLLALPLNPRDSATGLE